MLNVEEKKDKVYKKHNSFHSFRGKSQTGAEHTVQRIVKLKNNLKHLNPLSPTHKKVLDEAIKDLVNQKKKNQSIFKLSENVISEIETLNDDSVLRYIVHRYRYEMYPQLKIIDEYPPCLQIEPSSICNYRCVFCFETDKTFTNKKNGFMGTMKLDFFKNIIDNAEGKVEFVTLASRGEPLVGKEIDKMLEYTVGKFLNLKINTNASLLNAKMCHAILSGGVKTIVFSADAADEKLYKKLRVNGNLKTILKNIELFEKIRISKYPGKKIITRVSGVKFSKKQDFESMIDLWRGLVDQVAFVEYNPWENTYLRKPNKIVTPCSDLWRRMFIWWDGKTNPCDVDYKSNLSVGLFPNKTLNQLWRSQEYEKLRKLHLDSKRSELSPCKSCTVI